MFFWFRLSPSYCPKFISHRSLEADSARGTTPPAKSVPLLRLLETVLRSSRVTGGTKGARTVAEGMLVAQTSMRWNQVIGWLQAVEIQRRSGGLTVV